MTPHRQHRFGRIAQVALFVALALPAFGARAADPIIMFLLGFAKNLIESAVERNAAAKPAPTPVVTAPQPLPKAAARMDESDLRALVEDSFRHLNEAQRAELLASLDKALADPANSGYREAILNQFVGVARQVGFTHRQLERLSPEEKRMVAELFVANYRALSAEQQQILSQQLQARALPLPADLNDMMLAALALAR